MDAIKSVTASFTVNTHTVTPSAAGNGSISPNGIQTVNHGTTLIFTLTPFPGCVSTVGGTCPGALAGNTFTSAAIIGNCSVIAGFTQTTFTVTPSAGANGSISPAGPQNIGQGGIATFIVTPDPGFAATVGGSCNGNLVGNTYSTFPVSANCTVDASFSSALALVAVQSRKTHGTIGPFDLLIDGTQSIAGAVTVEPRLIGSGHLIVFQFNQPITSVTGASASPVGTATPSIAGTEVSVSLTGISDNQRVTVSLTNVNGGTPAQVSLGFLVGDVNNSHSVNSSDISSVKARLNQVTTSTNFKFDLNASGSINSSDISVVKARSGLTLP